MNIHIHHTITDDEYLLLVKETLQEYVIPFRPEIMFWNWGYDGPTGEYGDMGLSPTCQLNLARMITKTAWKLCAGRVIVVLCGGGRRGLAFTVIPKIIRILTGESS